MIPSLGVSMLAERLPVSQARDLFLLLLLAGEFDDERAPSALGEAPWDEVADIARALTVCQGRADLDNPIRPADADSPEFTGESVLGVPTSAPTCRLLRRPPRT